ncbi:hypothetical protein PHYPSEUDO_010494 [Phytophthora pseudosyringae]|uniref:Uncharacterized protein n=1 Tax=Phytophthora pseudosyringae TaxID=221518 RepID=A0A8T1W7T0_9STRA|nr:hypothetical protein PHYPSEUDO_010494 [Phytophthora pseudosyringae]
MRGSGPKADAEEVRCYECRAEGGGERRRSVVLTGVVDCCISDVTPSLLPDSSAAAMSTPNERISVDTLDRAMVLGRPPFAAMMNPDQTVGDYSLVPSEKI